MAPTSFEDDLRDRVDAAFATVPVSAGLADEVVRRGRRRVRRRRVATAAGAVVAVAAVTAGAVLVTPPSPSIAPMAPSGDAEELSDRELVELRRVEAERVAVVRRAEEEARRAAEGLERADVDAALRDVEEDRERAEADVDAPPVTGYGDFSEVDPFELDTSAVMLALGRCIADGGFDVSLVPPGDGLEFRSRAAGERHDACFAGLRVPEPTALTAEQVAISHAYQLALHACLADLGYELPPAPTELPTYGPGGEPQPDAWAPYSDLIERYPEVRHGARWDEVQMACPQGPIGGFGAWSPGDPVPSVDELPTLD